MAILSAELGQEFRIWWAMVWPTMLTNFSRMGMELTDTSMIGHLQGGNYLSSVSYSQIVIMSVMVIVTRGMGGSVVSALSATAYGAGNYKLMGIWLQMALLFCSLVAVLLMPIWIWGGNLLSAVVGHDHITGTAEGNIDLFMRISMAWMLPMCWSSCLNSFLVSQKIVHPQMIVQLCGFVLNLAANALFIYGFGWGYPGSPLATACSRWFVFLGLVTLIKCRYVQLVPGSWTGFTSPKELLRGPRVRIYLSQALPTALTGILEEYQLQTVAVFAGKVGPEAVATHNATFVLFFCLCGTMWAISSATSARVGHHLGRGDLQALRRVIQLASVAAGSWGLFVSVVMTAARQVAGKLYSSKPEVDALTAEIYTLVGPCFFLMSLFYVSMAVLTASCRQTLIVAAFMIGAWGVCVPTSFALAFYADASCLKWYPDRVPWDTGPNGRGVGLLGLWIGLAMGYVVTTVLALIGVCTSNWPKLAAEAAARSEARASLQHLAGSPEDGASASPGQHAQGMPAGTSMTELESSQVN